MVDYGRLSPLLVKSIQDLNNRTSKVYSTNGNVEAGDLSKITGGQNIEKAAANDQAAGVVENVFGGQANVVFIGQLPVKVSEENGPVKAGDRLAVSKTLPGYAMKMTESGQSIGIALENSEQITDNSKQTILVFVNLGYQQINVAQNADGQLVTTDNSKQITVNSIASLNGKWSIDDGGTLIAEKVQTKQLCLEDVCVNKDQLKTLLQNAGIISGASSPSAPPDPVPTPTPDITPVPDPAIAPATSQTPTPDLTPTPAPDPTLAPLPSADPMLTPAAPPTANP
jgi:hypothetical protein